MSYIPVTPFGRPVDATLIEHQNRVASATNIPDISKWDILREVAAARQRLGLHPRSIDLLQTLLSFHPKTILQGQGANLVVFPSNAAICERMHGIACSTMRRHLASLVNAGLILRRDSANGKRFVKRNGTAPQPFGFDLKPLLVRYEEFCALAEATRVAETKLQDLRRTVCLMRRDLEAFAQYGLQTQPNDHSWDAFDDTAKLTARTLRRNLNISDLQKLKVTLLKHLDAATAKLDVISTVQVSTSDSENEQHSQTSNKEYISVKKTRHIQYDLQSEPTTHKDSNQDIPLHLVCRAFTQAQDYSERPIQTWDDIQSTAKIVYPMMGIPKPQWLEAEKLMGRQTLSVVILAMLERFVELRSPGAYLRHLMKKAAENTFSCIPMVTALTQRTA